MKNKIFAVLFLATMLFACNQKKENADQTDSGTATTEASTDTMATDASGETAEKFACSMHPEIMGNKGEKCSKCNMDLTVAVTE